MSELRSQGLRDLSLLFRLGVEFWTGFYFLRTAKPAVTIFGSARLPSTHPYYQVTYDIAHFLGQRGFTVITGGGPSMMEAANRGAKDAGGKSLGISIQLPRETNWNSFVTAAFQCRYFFVRKVLLARYSKAFIYVPGGFGTLDELAEIVTLIQTGKMPAMPVIVVGRNFWKGFLDWCENTLIKEGTVSREEFNRIWVADTAEEVKQMLASLST